MSTKPLALAAFVLLSTCWAGPLHAAGPDARSQELLTRLEGVWARDSDGCAIYGSGQLDTTPPDSATVAKLSIVEFRNGHLDLKYQNAQCQITKAVRTGAGKYKFQATCVANGKSGSENGVMTFKYGEHLLIDFPHNTLPPLDLTGCAP